MLLVTYLSIVDLFSKQILGMIHHYVDEALIV